MKAAVQLLQHNTKYYNAAQQSKQRALAKLFGEEHESTAKGYFSLGVTQCQMHDYKEALQSDQRALAIRIKLFAESSSYFSLGGKTHGYKAAIQSHQRALAIRIKLFGEELKATATSALV